ncbi:TPA: YueH family protein [Bacillus mobilis]
MDAVNFEILENYGSPTVYFCEHEMKHSCLVAIPSWNWSFLIDYAIDFQDEKPQLMKALEKHVSQYNLENTADVFYDFVFSRS